MEDFTVNIPAQSKWQKVRNVFKESSHTFTSQVLQCSLNLRRESIKVIDSLLHFTVDSLVDGILKVKSDQEQTFTIKKGSQQFQVAVSDEITFILQANNLDDSQTTIYKRDKSIHQSCRIGGQLLTLQPVYGKQEDQIQKECVICLSEVKNCVVLPCRHFCLCLDCAESLRKQSSKCPICRADSSSILYLEISEK